MTEEVPLAGGVANAGSVVRVGAHVLRPPSPNAAVIHAVLRHVRQAGFAGVPEVVGIDPDGRERLVFVPGRVPVAPFPRWSQTDAVLASTVRLLRGFHDATAGFEAPPEAEWSTELADPAGGDVLCHNDVCPENVVYRDGEAIALLDFDFVAPGRRAWDVAALARMCVPIDTDADAARFGRGGLDPFARLAVVADAYGFDRDGRTEVLEVLAVQVHTVGDFVRRRIERGEAAFVEMAEQMGGLERYDRRAAWFDANRDRFASALGC